MKIDTSILTLSLLFRTAYSDHVTVGKDDWRIPSDGGPLPSRNFHVGETVTFEWTGFHNVYIHPSGNCTEDGRIEVGTTSPAKYTFKEDDVGTLTFVCDVGSHCEIGMMMTANVTAAAPPVPAPVRTAPIATPVDPTAPMPAADDSICVKYTKIVFGQDTADNELALITAVVNRAVLGDSSLNISGILAPEGGLAGFFNGAGPTTNRGGDTPVTVNFLDGAADLPNPDPNSNTAILLSHLYQFFGPLLGCAAADFPAYSGDPDMFRVHKFMGITQEMNDFFITQVTFSALSYGVTVDDANTIANSLDITFSTRCPPRVKEGDGLPAFLIGTNPSICQADSCPLAAGSPCSNTTEQSAAPTNAYNASTATPIPAADDSICVKYTKLVFGQDTADNELALITAVVNRAVLGDSSLNISGILAPEGGLAGFFNGAGPTTNRGGDTPVTVNFLDGAADLPNPDPNSNTAILLSHLYQFFGPLLGCTAAGFPAYSGDPDMFRVHKFMGITQEMNDFFITQVTFSALSFGVAVDDANAIANSLDATFSTRCPPRVMEGDGLPAFLIGTNPSICQADTCPLAAGSLCANTTEQSAAQTNAYNASTATPIPAADDSICVKYTKLVFGQDTADNELALITAVVNRAVLGDSSLDIPGILAPEGGLAGFFNGAGPTTNRGGDTPVTVNFLDGAADLPNPDPNSNTAILLSHLYQFFGPLLGCTAADFPAYSGDPDMFRVHKFMGITQEMNDYFIIQVAISALSFGVTVEDATAIANSLDMTFSTRCPPLVMEGDGLPAFLIGTNPSICQAENCPLAAGSPCANTTTTKHGSN